MSAPVARRQDYDYLIKLLLIGDSGTRLTGSCAIDLGWRAIRARVTAAEALEAALCFVWQHIFVCPTGAFVCH